jgi:hypothetical protein
MDEADAAFGSAMSAWKIAINAWHGRIGVELGDLEICCKAFTTQSYWSFR